MVDYQLVNEFAVANLIGQDLSATCVFIGASLFLDSIFFKTVNEQATAEFRFEPSRLGRHDLAGIADVD